LTPRIRLCVRNGVSVMFVGGAFLVFGIGALCVLICRLAVNALPAFVSFTVGFGSSGTGAGPVGAIFLALLAGTGTLAAGRAVFHSTCVCWSWRPHYRADRSGAAIRCWSRRSVRARMGQVGDQLIDHTVRPHQLSTATIRNVTRRRNSYHHVNGLLSSSAQLTGQCGRGKLSLRSPRPRTGGPSSHPFLSTESSSTARSSCGSLPAA
jgi:hypothetical protein